MINKSSYNNDKNNPTEIIISLFIFIFALISIFISLEIIELKCCGINKNKRRNILIREKIDIDKIGTNENIYKEYEDEDENIKTTENRKIELNERYMIDLSNVPNRESKYLKE